MRSHFWHKSATAVVAMTLVACGGGGDAGSAGGGDTGGADAPAAAPAVDMSSVGTISGMVNFAGDAPAMMAVDMSAEPDCAAGFTGDGPMTQNVLVSNGGLANVFVYLSDAPAGGTATTTPVLDQQNCRYTPHVLGAMVGQDIEIRNSDPVLHNIQATPSENRPFNISQPREGMTTNRSFAVAEVMVPVQCDVHGWMQAYVGVLDHPYFGVSGTNGSFSIPNVPAGDYTLTAWHEEYGTMTASVSVTAGGTAEVSFDYDASMAGADVPMGDALVIEHGTDRVRFDRAAQ